MGRKIGAVVLGYVTMFAGVFILFSTTYLLLGPGRSFQAGSCDVSAAWIIASIVLGFVAALLGGKVCLAVGKTRGTVQALAGLVIVLGLVFAIPVFTGPGEASAVACDGLGGMEAMQEAIQPVWMALLNPVIGAVGVLLGGRKKAA
jgi:hypothetical protein